MLNFIYGLVIGGVLGMIFVIGVVCWRQNKFARDFKAYWERPWYGEEGEL